MQVDLAWIDHFQPIGCKDWLKDVVLVRHRGQAQVANPLLFRQSGTTTALRVDYSRFGTNNPG